MNVNYTKEDLINFENEIIQAFENKLIMAPIHLYSNNEEQMIEIFKNVRDNDWVLCTWRSHYQCLLKGVSPSLLKEKILDGRSISLCFRDYKIISSAIVGGIIPIALGIGLANKLNNVEDKVFCFMGDMSSETGIAHESIKYSLNNNLNIYWVIEDNNKSVCTDTRKVWKTQNLTYENCNSDKIIYYKYNNKYSHAGAGKRIQF